MGNSMRTASIEFPI